MKRGTANKTFIFLLISILILSSLVLAAETKAPDTAKAYKCLESELNNKTTLSFDQARYAALARSSTAKIDAVLDSNKATSEACWPKGNCGLKETAQMLLVYNRQGKSTTEIENWLLSKNITPTDLNWYLEIDIKDKSYSKCKIKFGSSSGTFEILSSMAVQKNTATSCLSISQNGYWLKIAQSCIDKEFEISCDKDFVTAVLYDRKSGETVYVSSESHNQAANGTTKEQVKSKCFATKTTCDYEGGLWASMILNKVGKDVSLFTPYLAAFMEDNSKYFSSSFLYSISSKKTGADEFYSDIVLKQRGDGLWSISGSKQSKYYDTSIAMLALNGNKNAGELDKAKAALAELQNSYGCWSDIDPIIDTSFILYSGWPIEIKTGNGGSSNTQICSSVSGQSCQSRTDCTDAGGSELTAFECSGGKICCSKEVILQSCSQQSGKICGSDEICDDAPISSSDGSCCLGTCSKKPQTTATCTGADRSCKISCKSTETEDKSKTCSSSDEICCLEQTTEKGGLNWFLIILIILLIALIVLAIVFRDKLRVWWFTFKGKASVSPVIKPGAPPFGKSPTEDFKPNPKFAPQPFNRPAMPQRPMPPQRRPLSPNPRDKEMEETLKKLKEMSK